MLKKIWSVLRQSIHNWRCSLKATILWLFIPVIILMVLVIGMLTYSLAAQQIEANAYVNIRDTVTQTGNYLDNRLTAIFEQLVALENDIDTLSLLKRLDSQGYGSIQPGDYIRMDRNLERIFSSYYSILDSILVYFANGRLILSKKDYMTARISFDYSQWRSGFWGNRTEYYWRNLHDNDIFQSPETENRIASVFKLYGNEKARLHGIILFNLREDFFQNILQNAKISENGRLTLITQGSMVNFKTVSERYLIDNQTQKMLLDRQEPSGRLRIRNAAGEKMMLIYDTLPINGWKLVAVFPEDDILNKAGFIKRITLAVMFLLILAAAFLSNLLAQIVTRPLSALTEKVKRVQAGNLDVPFDNNDSNEIGILNEGIYELLGRVRNLLNQVRLEQEQKRLAELETLQAQIKPHFLYNTLDSIRQLCEMGETRDAGAMVGALAKFFRISISGGKEIISLADEVEHIQSYLLILKMRYIDDFDYQIKLDQEVSQCKVIKLTLQPLVENAIYHGIKQKRGKGQLVVNCQRNGAKLILEVCDSGAGMSDSQLEQVRKSLLGAEGGRGYGLSNVHRRLQLHYGSEYGLEIESKLGEGTRVRVTLPAGE